MVPPALCISPALRRRVGGFDSRLPIMEDADLCARMHLAGELKLARACSSPWQEAVLLF